MNITTRIDYRKTGPAAPVHAPSYAPVLSIVRALVLATGILAAGAACALEIKLPSETATLRQSTMAGAANASQCLMCHSADYMSSQPPMGHTFWEAEVNKMIKTYGAPIPPDQVPALAEYLNSVYGADARKKTEQK